MATTETNAAKQLKVAIAAGGTAGHVNPALALAEELRSRGHSVRFFGQTRRLEGRLVPQAGFDFFPVNVSGFDRQRPWTLATALVHLSHEERRIVKAFKDDPSLRPDVCIGFGAYVELPLMRAAAKLGIPYALHEQNSVPGLANKQSAKRASLIGITQPSVAEVFKKAGASEGVIKLTGNPVRQQVLQGSRSAGRAKVQVPEDATMLLVFGGSLGAQHINEEMARLKQQLMAIPNLYIVHSTGADGYDACAQELALTDDEAKRYKLLSYIDGMGDMLAASDLVLSRAGASSIAEIAALAVPSVLVPYPFATADHQTTNARYLVDAGAAIMCKDADLPQQAFTDEFLGLLQSPQKRADMRAAAQKLGQAQAAQKLADALCALAS